MSRLLVLFVLVAATCVAASAFVPSSLNRHGGRSASSFRMSENSPQVEINLNVEMLELCKGDLVRSCSQATKPSAEEIRKLARNVEEMGEQIGVGQASSLSGLMSGEWELLYSPEDETRSSPFFWSFSRAVDNSDQIFAITDAIPAPVKEVGPAFQKIDIDSSGQGTLVSRVKVATLGGAATSWMTTRCTVLRAEGLDGLRLRIDSTKPEDSTALKKLGPLGSFINENAPPFPSGEALERIRPGSSEVVMQTTYCDEGLRISRNEDAFSDVYVWKRKSFGDNYDL